MTYELKFSADGRAWVPANAFDADGKPQAITEAERRAKIFATHGSAGAAFIWFNVSRVNDSGMAFSFSDCITA
jgi:hypothetical protein